MNHALTFYVIQSELTATNQIILLNFSLDPFYQTFLQIDYGYQISALSITQNTVTHKIFIPKVLEPDFPDLTQLKENLKTYVIFS